jgi:5'-nucleotidase
VTDETRSVRALRDGSDLTQSAGVPADAFVLGVDLDGVCADYTGAFRGVVAAELGVDASTLGNQVSWDFIEWGITGREHFLELHHQGVIKHRMFASMQPIHGAAESLWRLSDAGVWIRVITHRLHVKGGHGVAVSDTCSWLDAHDIPFRDICFLGAKNSVDCDLYIDDSPGNIASLRASGCDAVVFDQPYNSEVDGPRVRGWGEVERYVLDQLAERVDV